MKNIVIFGYGFQGIQAHRWLRKQPNYVFYGFADNSEYKKGYYIDGKRIVDIEELSYINHETDISVVIAATRWWEIADQCEKRNICVEGIFREGSLHSSEHMQFNKLDLTKEIKLYAGDIEDEIHYNENNLYGISINKSDERHIFHNIMERYPLPDNCICRYEAEEVLEYVPKERQKSTLNEICRILKKGCICRITIPDFNSPYLRSRTMTDSDGKLIFDAGAGGHYGQNGIENGLVYFSTYEGFKEILEQTNFTSFDWLCYYSKDGVLHKKCIDMSKGYNKRVNNDSDEDVYCIVVDCYK